MVKAETLSKLNLEELINTPFEDLMEVREVPAGEMVVESDGDKVKACFIYKGSVQVVTYTIEGKGVYTYRGTGDIFRVAQSFADKIKKNIHTDSEYGTDIYPREDSVIVYLPLGKIMEMELENKEEVLKKIILITAEEKLRESSYFMGRLVYSDEEFILKALDKIKTIEASTTKELSRALNMNLRNLQRLLNKLEDMDIITREGGRVSIKDLDKFYEYKEKIEK
ncbi:hypothetical protein PM10SUCC1_20780 [Propionigenium maris DSM 9537]|uniref:cAMP-binding domain of CRP or a regulatory subunit of cAMP-dependent protein kinases n=1 Tax=Propionigenium maris DSM 9537 TaxID=1123000 RepID=A0A9W6GMI8_9FUSO|nr:hypothetical protein [Propionigenium maris]GLI56564.1 hypothetical protein PM10SUCC1_20780 [Propionigenium maris DSM 9537]